MAETLVAAFAAQYPDNPPAWIPPFVKAVRRMEIVEKREETGTMVTSENKPEPVKKPKKSKAKGKSKGKGKVAEKDDDDDGLGQDVEDVEMMRSAEEYLAQVRRNLPSPLQRCVPRLTVAFFL